MDFSGKTAVITGAAQGIGLAVARRFAAAGAVAVVADLSPPPDKMAFYKTDVSREDEVRALFAHVKKQCGGADILVNNAGVALEKSLEDTTAEEWEKVMAVNVRGVFLCAKHAAAQMRARGGGAIINIGSIEASGANPMHAAYAASKGAVHSMTRNIALEFGADNIRCNAVAPGWIDTPFNEKLLAQYPDPQRAREAVCKLHPAGKMGTPDDVAAAVMWLASADSVFTNGQIYVHDGGRTARLPLPLL